MILQNIFSGVVSYGTLFPLEKKGCVLTVLYNYIITLYNYIICKKIPIFSVLGGKS